MIKCIYVDRIKMIGKTPDCVYVVALLLLTILLISPSMSAQPFGTIPAPIPNNLQVFALPVGQGDCTIIQCPNGNIIVYDCGSAGGNGLTATEVKHWLGPRIDHVSYILITHPHADHHNYLPGIFSNNNALKGIIIGGQLDDYTGYTHNWLNNMNRVYLVNNGQRCIGNNPVCAVNINIGTNFCNSQYYQFSILAANVRNNPNEMSIVMRVAFGGWSMLLSGDMEGTALNEITNQLRGGLQSVVYKMSHHGATRANTDQWVSQINPQYAFASSGYNYGICRHPTCTAVLTLLTNSIIDKTAPPHPFYCGNGRSSHPINFARFRYNILETSPNNMDICLLTYISDATIQPVAACVRLMLQAQTQFTKETAYSEEECDDSTAEGGGALCVAASYFSLLP